MQARLLACIIIRALFSVVEFQRQLNVPWGLGTGNLPHRGSQTHVGCVVLDMVKSVDEVGSELQPETLCNWEIFVQTQVNVAVMWRTEIGKLRRAVAECSGCGLCELPIVDEPLTANSR